MPQWASLSLRTAGAGNGAAFPIARHGAGTEDEDRLRLLPIHVPSSFVVIAFRAFSALVHLCFTPGFPMGAGASGHSGLVRIQSVDRSAGGVTRCLFLDVGGTDGLFCIGRDRLDDVPFRDQTTRLAACSILFRVHACRHVSWLPEIFKWTPDHQLGKSFQTLTRPPGIAFSEKAFYIYPHARTLSGFRSYPFKGDIPIPSFARPHSIQTSCASRFY